MSVLKNIFGVLGMCADAYLQLRSSDHRRLLRGC